MRYPCQSSLHRIAAATTVFSHSSAAVMSTRPPFRGGGGRGHRNFAGNSHGANFKFNYNAQSYNYSTHQNNQNNFVVSGGGGGGGGGSGAPPNRRQNQGIGGVRRQKPADFRTWEFAKQLPPPDFERFVVLSYNILADYLANGHRNLYFHIPRQFMSWEWRKSNILFELKLWSPDIMCFQEVDKFQELEEDLRVRGYSGIWKMRTGDPVDGCALFFRTTRFKLMYEDCIEYNKHGMRDNVAQICVLESLNQNQRWDQLSSSFSGPNRVVVCNIHVLYNPRRGEMKLGQVRMLLEKAHAVSKTWDDAPIVLCGDFNCTPKSALYNFIAEQKINISQVERDNVSGQASAEIRLASRPYSYNFRGQPSANMDPTMTLNNMSEKDTKNTDNFNSQSDNSCSSYPKSVEEGTVDPTGGLPSPPAGDLDTSDLGEMVVKADTIVKNKPLYNPSLWTTMEKVTATGNTDITVLEHPLKLQSTYAEVVDSSGTRDPCGEPLVTSYNSCFMGTVDYIWRSEGLQTVKVLAPIRKDVMQPSGGFPTKKWGSDHIALASELAFTR